MNKASKSLGSELHKKLYTGLPSEVRDNPRGQFCEPLYLRLHSQLARPLFSWLYTQLFEKVEKDLQHEQSE